MSIEKVGEKEKQGIINHKENEQKFVMPSSIVNFIDKAKARNEKMRAKYEIPILDLSLGRLIFFLILFGVIVLIYILMVVITFVSGKMNDLRFLFFLSSACVVLNTFYIIHLFFNQKLKLPTHVLTIVCIAIIDITYAVPLFSINKMGVTIVLLVILFFFLGLLAIVVTRNWKINNRMAYLMNCVAMVLFLNSSIIYGLQAKYGILFDEEKELDVNQIVYYVTVTFSTVGYGDFYPIKESIPAMAISTIMSLTNIYMLIIVFGGLSFLTRNNNDDSK